MAATQYIIEVAIDEDPQNPRDDDNLSCMVCFHRRYVLGDERGGEHVYYRDEHSGWDELEKAIIKDGAAVVMPLYLLDHSGITISTSPFACNSDSGKVGFVFATRKSILDTYGVKRITEQTKKLVEDVLRQEVKIYDQYLRGDVWGFVIQDEHGKAYDSCWNFYGEAVAREEAERVVKRLETRDAEEAQELLRTQAAMPCCLP